MRMIRALAIVALLALLAPAANAQACGSQEGAEAYFLRTFGEVPVEDSALPADMLRFRNALTGTWTLFKVQPDGSLCMDSFGTDSPA